MSEQLHPTPGTPRNPMRLAAAGLITIALGASAALFAETLMPTNPAPATTTSASAPASTATSAATLPTHPRPHPLRDPGEASTVPPPSGRINARIGGGPIDAGANSGQRNAAPGIPANSGQTLTTTLPPPGDDVEVFKNNHWLPAQVIKRENNQVYVRFDGEGEASNEWVGPNRVRSR